LLDRFPIDLQYKFETIVNENKYFTIADLWLLAPHAGEEERDETQLFASIGYINQQSFADALEFGIAGSDWGHGWRKNASEIIRPEAASYKTPSFQEVLEQAQFSMRVPALYLLAKLSPMDVAELRNAAENMVFDLSVQNDESEQEIFGKISSATENYWNYVCEYIQRKYPKDALKKTNMHAFLTNNFPSAMNFASMSVKHLELGVDFAVKASDPFSPTTNFVIKGSTNIIKTFGFKFFYEPSRALSQLQNMKTNMWGPRAAWVSSQAKDVRDVRS
jgi:hypothetical protein